MVDGENGEGAKNTMTTKPLKILLAGYNGKNNTGSEARLLSIIDDVRQVFGTDAQIIIPTLNEKNLRRYVKEAPNLRIEKIPTIFYGPLRSLARESDLVILTEGSCYMDTWGSPLLWAFLWTTRSAAKAGKLTMAYAVDTGRLSPGNCRRVKRDASLTSLIVTRTKAAADRLQACGVTSPLEVTEDAAFTFQTNPQDDRILEKEWPEASSGVVGFAVVNFHLWPVVAMPFGRRSRCYQWPYYFSDSPGRRKDTEDLAQHWAAEADRIVGRYGKKVALISMESVDDTLAEQIQSLMTHKKEVRLFSSSNYNASQMTSILRSLDMLITSRYHACVLSLQGGVPQVAIGHDIRLEEIYKELGMSDLFFNFKTQDLWSKVASTVDSILNDPRPYQQVVIRGYEKSVKEASRNRLLLREFALKHGLAVQDQ